MKRALFIGLLLLVGLAALVALRKAMRTAEVNRRIAALRTAGWPTTSEECNQWYPAVPNAENAALVVTQALRLWRHYDPTNSRNQELTTFRSAPHTGPLSPSQRELLTDYLAMNEASLALMREAVRLPRSRYPVDLRLGPDTPLPHLQLHWLAEAESFAALLAIGTSRSNQVTASITNILGLARTLDEEPIWISHAVRNRVLRHATRIVERILPLNQWSGEQLADLQEAFVASERTNLLTRALMGHGAMCLPLFRTNLAEIERVRQMAAQMYPEEIGQALPGREAWRYRILQWFDRDLQFFLETIETNLMVASLPAPRNLVLESNLQTQIAVAKARHFCLSQTALVIMQKTTKHEWGTRAHVGFAITALAIERFRLERGRLPVGLGELVPRFLPTTPVDPFTGAAFRYRSSRQGYTVESAGRDPGSPLPSDETNSTAFLKLTIER